MIYMRNVHSRDASWDRCIEDLGFSRYSPVTFRYTTGDTFVRAFTMKGDEIGNVWNPDMFSLVKGGSKVLGGIDFENFLEIYDRLYKI